jgi:hypothetical protein
MAPMLWTPLLRLGFYDLILLYPYLLILPKHLYPDDSLGIYRIYLSRKYQLLKLARASSRTNIRSNRLALIGIPFSKEGHTPKSSVS